MRPRAPSPRSSRNAHRLGQALLRQQRIDQLATLRTHYHLCISYTQERRQATRQAQRGLPLRRSRALAHLCRSHRHGHPSTSSMDGRKGHGANDLLYHERGRQGVRLPKRQGHRRAAAAGASLDARTGSITHASQRSEYMNQHSGSVVQREREKVSWGKWAAMGGGFIAGGLVIGLTGGLAAPLIAPALVGLTGVSFLATSGGIIMLGTLFGLGGGGLAGYRVNDVCAVCRRSRLLSWRQKRARQASPFRACMRPSAAVDCCSRRNSRSRRGRTSSRAQGTAATRLPSSARPT